jgi:hypothetical protein
MSLKRVTLFVALVVLAAMALLDAQQPAEGRPPDDVRGDWTIYSKNVNNDRTVEKYVTIHQDGNKLSGHFKGPNQSGGIQGWVNGHHIEFSTKTRNVLTFRGQIDGNHMSGMYGIHGRHAEWRAVRTD